MLKKYVSVILVSICLLCSLGAQEAEPYSIRHYSSAEGLSQNTVMSILQDADGFMWFGTWDGLNRFDGYVFKTYKPSLAGRQIASNRVDFLYEDSLHFLWMNTNDGGFYRLNKHTDHILATEIRETRFGKQRNQDMRNILEQKKGVIWLAGAHDVLRIQEKTGRHSDETERQQYTLEGDVNCLIADREGSVWAGTTCGVDRISGISVEHFLPGNTESENHITAACLEGNRLWFGTESGVIWRYNVVSRQFERTRINLRSRINCIKPAGEHRLVICTAADGFCLYDTRSGMSNLYTTHLKNIHNNCFLNAYVDRYSDIWLINEEAGVLHYITRDDCVERLVSQPDMRHRKLQDYNFIFAEDKEGNLWMNPYGGGFARYDRETNSLKSELGGISNIVHSAFVDSQDNLWVGSYDSGVDCLSAKQHKFSLTDLRGEDEAAEVRALCQLTDGSVLVASREGVVRRYTEGGVLLQKEVLNERIYSILETADGTVVYGTKGGGIITWKAGKTTRYQHTQDPYSLLSDNVYDMVYGADSTLYIATYGGGIHIYKDGQRIGTESAGRFIHVGNDWETYPDFGSKVRQLCFANDSVLWAATTNGLVRVNTRTLETQQTPYYDLRAVYKSADGHMWLGSFGGGLVEVLDPMAEDVFEAKNIRTYSSQNGLGSDIVLSIVGDNNGSLWVNDENGVSYYDRTSGNFQHYNALSEFDKAMFSEAKGILLSSGRLVFGCNIGCCSFASDRVFESTDAPVIRFTNLLVLNEPMEIGHTISDNICYSPKVSLRHSEKVFTIEYSALDYAPSSRIQYAYRIDGVDKDWNYVQGERRVTYSTLPAGDYTFRVKSTNGDGIWCDNEQTLSIHIAPSFWATPWAFMIYFAVLLAIAWFAYSSLSTASELRQEMEVEQKVTEIKLRFFTNISHELRTPLTLITGPVETVLHSAEISPQVRMQLEIVQSNASRMLRLINQILDFRKIQNNQMKLRIQHTDVAALAKETFSNFTKEAADKHIDFRFENDMTDPIAWVDKEKVDTIIYNLLSNAFKFTPAGKSIVLRMTEKPEFIIIEVSDTGVGIPKDKRSLLFQRFSSHNEINASQEKTGTGIGLNLVKELVDLQKGYIEVDSEVGKGSTFSVLLLRNKEHFGNDASVVVDDQQASEPQEEMQEEPLEGTDNDKKNVLVADDNTDMRTFLQSILAEDYNIWQATDGQEAFAIAKQHNFDLIITDLMMPNVDGLELTEMLKSDMSTSHVPVILLTAKSAIESRLQALEYGADDYITKPFSPEYLQARIDNIIRQRQRLQETYRAQMMQPEKSVEPKPLSPNEIFLQKLYQFMVDNMDNNELSVEDMVKEMALGRTVFFNKLKGLTGLSPVEYIRDVRIKHAAELLLDGKYNVTEVTYMVGMNDSRYFAKCFKNAYGLTPTEYKKQHENKDA